MSHRRYEGILGRLPEDVPLASGGRSKTRALTDEITGWIARGLLGPGDRLPSTGALCDRYGVSTEVVRGSMQWLKGRGLVEGVPGVGVFVADRPRGSRRRRRRQRVE
jgi:DNA-binding GntR family transcriptional regulator